MTLLSDYININIILSSMLNLGFPLCGISGEKNSLKLMQEVPEMQVQSWLGRSPEGGSRNPLQVVFPGKFHGQEPGSYSP